MKLNHVAGTDTISAALGISSTKETELEVLVKRLASQEEGSISDDLSSIADACSTPEELAWAAYELGQLRGQNGPESIFAQLMAAGDTQDDWGGPSEDDGI